MDPDSYLENTDPEPALDPEHALDPDPALDPEPALDQTDLAQT